MHKNRYHGHWSGHHVETDDHLYLRHWFLICMIFALVPLLARSQPAKPPQNWFSDGRYSIQLGYQKGGVFKTNDFVSGINAAGKPIDFYQGFSFNLSRQTRGTKLWEQLYGYPRIGVGCLTADFRSEELGKPISVYGFLTGPFFRIGPFSLNYHYALGLAGNWNKYHPTANPFNRAICSDINVLVEGGIAADIRVIPRVNVTAGYALTHHSNGGIIQPNFGVNTHYWKFSARYNLYSGNPVKPVMEYEKFKPTNRYMIAAYTGFKMADMPGIWHPSGRPYRVPVWACGVFATYYRQLGYKSKIGAGIQFGYNGIYKPQFDLIGDRFFLNRKPDSRRIDLSIFPSYELTFDRFSIFAEAGFYLHRDDLIKFGPVFHQRIGFRYFFTDHLFAAVQIRAHKFGQAEMIEWTTGYRF
jgi:hypothetical protein